MKRIGILGGMYNPVHDGHLRAAIEARELLGLDEVRLVPCAAPPHREAPGVSATLRAEMVAAAVAGIEFLALDARELELPPPSYTLRTLESLRAEMPDAAFVLLLGEDAFRGFDRWHEWQKVAALARIAVMRRPGNEDLELPSSLQAWLREVEVAQEKLFDGDTPAVTFCEITALGISSTHIRGLRAANRDPRFLLPDAVLDIIERENLYKERN
ncbi:MAG TPA: nicotinate-nucleotide adenylyltransferase [Gammaproteobacteria bacterium]